MRLKFNLNFSLSLIISYTVIIMGRFVYNHTSQTTNPLDENRLRRPEADSDLTGTEYYQIRSEAYTQTNAGFRPGNPADYSPQTPQNQSSSKISYLKAEIDFMVDGFMRELMDFEAFSNLDPEIQREILDRYPQFFS